MRYVVSNMCGWDMLWVGVGHRCGLGMLWDGVGGVCCG